MIWPGDHFLRLAVFFSGLFFAQGTSVAGEALHQCSPGPWGDLEYFYTFLEAPGHIMDLTNAPSEKTIWVFPDKSIDEIRGFLESANLSDQIIEGIFDRSIPYQLGSLYKLFPDTEIVKELTPDSRGKIYSELRKHALNPYFHTPVIIESGNVEGWFKNSGISPKNIDLIESLSYKKGGLLMFSDIPVLLQEMKTEVEEKRLLKALTRTRSLVVRLNLDRETEINQISKYWSAGLKQKAILPILESYIASPHVEAIDVVHLLPPTPRKYLYTFPAPELGIDGIYPDSFWTAFNFFHYIPLEEFDRQHAVNKVLQNSFFEVDEPRKFGDVILVRRSKTKRMIHACVFIADDIVYTKLGRSLVKPFTMMRLENLLPRFGTSEQISVSVWRRKVETE